MFHDRQAVHRLQRVAEAAKDRFQECGHLPACSRLNVIVRGATSWSMNGEFEPLFKLARAERLQLVEDLWDSIAQEDAALPVSDEKREELRRRKVRFLAHPNSGRTWEQVKQRARAA